ncbi:MAG TPA: N-glycosylase/DNA lyase [Nitrospirota bacterium]|nr:N-glycosylase/DNA lyase [Nitrospirota bacterium]
MLGRRYISELKQDYQTKKPLIVKRLHEFRKVFDQGDSAIFEELCYCILTAGSSAKMGMRTVNALRDILITGSLQDLQQRARENHVRFWRIRPFYIVQTREYLKNAYSFELQTLLGSFKCSQSRRDFFATNKSIKGIAYKEASHFLRNIGFPGYAILDKHILNGLREMGVINKRMSATTRKGYLTIENRLERFAQEIDIDMDHLDLLLWSRKTGEILK